MEHNKFQIPFENGKPKLDKKISLEVLCANREPEDKDERYHFHLALEFFKNNFSTFDEKEIREVCSNPYSAKRLGGHFDITVLELCVKKGEPFPIVLPTWKDKKIKNKLLKSYFALINKEGHTEQLTFFLENFHNPMMEFIEENKRHISKALYEGIAARVFNPKTQKKDLNSIIDILVNRDISILEYLANNHTTEFGELLAIPLNDSNNKQATLNVGQYLLLNRSHESLNSIDQIFSAHKNTLLEPVNVRICLYDKKTSLFEYGLTNSKFMAFAPFSLSDDLNEENKEQMVSTAFYLLQYKHDPLQNSNFYSTNSISGFKEVLQTWYPSIIEEATDNQVFYYAKKAMEGKENDKGLKKEIEAIVLHRELNKNLGTNQSNNKKLKI